MAAVQIHGGDFGKQKSILMRSLTGSTSLRLSNGFGRGHTKVQLSKHIASCQITDTSSSKSFTKAAGAGLGGMLLLGPAGLLAAGLAAGNKRDVSFICTLTDGRRMACTTDRRTFDTHFVQYVGQEPQPTAPAPTTSSPAEEIERLAGLHAAGHLNDDEFAAAKAQVLGTKAA